MYNRSVPVDTLLPHVFYEDVATAAAWLGKTFGFVEHYNFKLPDGRIHGSLLYLKDVWIMLKSPGVSATSPTKLGGLTQTLMIFVEDIESHYQIAKSGNAIIVEELHLTEYGEQQYVVVDPEGHQWIFAKHFRDVNPEAWGAELSSLKE